MTEREVLCNLIRRIGALTYGKERWFKVNGCWYDKEVGDYIQNETLLERVTKSILEEIDDD